MQHGNYWTRGVGLDADTALGAVLTTPLTQNSIIPVLHALRRNCVAGTLLIIHKFSPKYIIQSLCQYKTR